MLQLIVIYNTLNNKRERETRIERGRDDKTFNSLYAARYYISHRMHNTRKQIISLNSACLVYLYAANAVGQ